MLAQGFFPAVILAALLLTSGVSAETLYDPTRPPGEPAQMKTQSQRSLQLQSVLIGSKRKIAIINGRRYVEGDRIASGKIASITRRSVTVTLAEKSVLLRLGRKDVKQRKGS